MSAIFGIMHTDCSPVSADNLMRMDSVMAGYGSDDSGIWHHDTVGLGQRLMRFTPEDYFEKQPLISADGNFILVADARIDNRHELTAQLGLSASESQQMPDSAFIMLAYEKWGLDCCVHLIGPFAIALWDEREQRLLLARSHMGERPLYYHTTSKTVAFATLPKGLFALPHIKRELDLEYIADYLALAPLTHGSSFYTGIHRLQAGHRLVVTRSGTTCQRYWQLDDTRELKLASDEEYVEAFNELFERVVADHLRSITPVGVMMSGGFDSSTVAAVAACQLKTQGKRLTTFTEVPRPGFDGPIMKGRYADETPYIQAMAQMYDNLDPHFVRSGDKYYLDDICRFYEAADMPFTNASNRTWIEAILADASQQNTRVLLDGGKGNLTISWDGKGLLPQLISSGNFSGAWQETGNISTSSRLRCLLGQGIMPLMPNLLWHFCQMIKRPSRLFKCYNEPPWSKYSPIRINFAQQQKVIDRASIYGWDFLFRTRNDSRLTRLTTFSRLDGTNGSDYSSAYKMLYGVDRRDPTGDVRIAKFCLSLPEDQCRRKGSSRWLLRRSMAGRLPAKILENQKRGLQSAGWFEPMISAQHEIHKELCLLKKSPLASMILDVENMQKQINQLDIYSTSRPDAGAMQSINKGIIERGLMTGRFLRWFENSEIK